MTCMPLVHGPRREVITLAQAEHISCWLDQALLWSRRNDGPCWSLGMCSHILPYLLAWLLFDRALRRALNRRTASILLRLFIATLFACAICRWDLRAMLSVQCRQLFEFLGLLCAKLNKVDVFSFGLRLKLKCWVIMQLHGGFHSWHHFIIVVRWKSMLEFDCICCILEVLYLFGRFIEDFEWWTV